MLLARGRRVGVPPCDFASDVPTSAVTITRVFRRSFGQARSRSVFLNCADRSGCHGETPRRRNVEAFRVLPHERFGRRTRAANRGRAPLIYLLSPSHESDKVELPGVFGHTFGWPSSTEIFRCTNSQSRPQSRRYDAAASPSRRSRPEASARSLSLSPA